MTITPQKVEARLYELSQEIDQAHKELVDDEAEYHRLTALYEVGLAKTRIKYAQSDMKMTATMREDFALIENSELHHAVALIEARVKASRANVQRIRTQVDIARSISVSVRASVEIA